MTSERIVKLTEAQRQILSFIERGEWLGFNAMPAINYLEKRGLIEEVKTGFISQVTFRITDAGRTALSKVK